MFWARILCKLTKILHSIYAISILMLTATYIKDLIAVAYSKLLQASEFGISHFSNVMFGSIGVDMGFVSHMPCFSIIFLTYVH